MERNVGGTEKFLDKINSLVHGNFGAIRVVQELQTLDGLAMVATVAYLSACDIKGWKLWVLYKDICNYDVKLMHRALASYVVDNSTIDNAFEGCDKFRQATKDIGNNDVEFTRIARELIFKLVEEKKDV